MAQKGSCVLAERLSTPPAELRTVPETSKPSYLPQLLKVLFAVFLVFLIVTFVDIKRTIEVLKDISPVYFSLAVMFVVFDQFLLGFKWNILLRVFGINVPNMVPIMAYLRGKVFEIAAPSTLGVDAFKVYVLSKRTTVSADNIMSSIVVERFFGALSSFIIIGILFYFAIAPFEIPYKVGLSILAALGSVFVILFVAFLLNHAGKTAHFNAWSKLPKKVQELVSKVVNNLHSISSNKSSVFAYLAMSTLEKLSYGVVICLCVKAIGGIEGIDYLFILAATPLMALLERLPISMGAIGLREGFYMLLFAAFTTDTAAILAVALAVRACEAVMIIVLSLTWIGKRDDWKPQNIAAS